MKHLRDFFGELEWWRLEPAHSLIRNQPENITRRMVLARTARADFAVAYLPGNTGIEVDVAGFPSALKARWFDPVRGTFTPIAGSVKNEGTHCFPAPGEQDWVLLLETL